MLRAIFGVSLIALLAGCAHLEQPKPVAPKAMKAKHVEPCPCSPTANQVVQKRWYDGFKVRWLH